MDMLERIRHPRSRREHARSAATAHEFVTHDQRRADACELEFRDLDERERTIFLRCGFHGPRLA